MSAFWSTLLAELRKLGTLPGVWIAAAAAVIGSGGITALNAFTVRGAVESGSIERLADTSMFESGFAAIPILGVAASVAIGALAIGSEYTADRAEAGGARQLATSLTATPNRLLLFLTKALVVALATAATAAVAIPANYALALVISGGLGTEVVSADAMLTRSLGAALYWVLMALIAFAITALARSVMIPLVVLIANSSLVSVTLLLSNLTPLANWLPDMAGRNLFGFSPEYAMPGGLEPQLGSIVMAAWAVGLVALAAGFFHRRDA